MTSITTLSKKHFDAEMLFADTNSLTNEIKSKDVDEEFFRLKQLFECTNYIQRIRSFLIELIKNLVKGKTCLKEK